MVAVTAAATAATTAEAEATAAAAAAAPEATEAMEATAAVGRGQRGLAAAWNHMEAARASALSCNGRFGATLEAYAGTYAAIAPRDGQT